MAVANPNPSKRKILIVEDSKYQAVNLARLLEKEGYHVTSANNGIQGLYKMQEILPDLIITDVWMPEMDGYDFCRTIKDDKELRHTPVILLTTLSQSKDLVKGLNAGADYYLTKPYSPTLLISMIAHIMEGQDTEPVRRIERLEVRSQGEVQTISADIRQVTNFLFSTYGNLIEHNKQLSETKRKLNSLNDNLELKIREKTLSLQHEARERQKANEALQRTLSQTVAALARTVEMRDPYTAGHQMRVAELAFKIAQQLGFSKEKSEGVRVMGMLHDIGKSCGACRNTLKTEQA